MEKQGHVKKIGDQIFNYLIHDSLFDFDAFVDNELMNNLSDGNRSIYKEIQDSSINKINSNNQEWFGGPVTSINELKEHKVFQQPELIRKVEDEIRNSLEEFLKIEMRNWTQVRKVSYNSHGLGIFSFDRASLGLHKIITEEGQEKITTSVRNVYAYFQNKPTKSKCVKIYILSGSAWVISGHKMLYTGMSVLVLAEFLMLRNYAVEIYAVIGTYTDSYLINLIKVKQFSDFLDSNLIALLTSDPKYYRYKGFLALIATCNKFGKIIPSGLGQMVEKYDMQEFIKGENDPDTTQIISQQNFSLEDARSSIVNEWNRLKIQENEHKNADNEQDTGQA